MKEPTDKKPTLPTYNVTFNSGPWYPYPTYPFLPPSPAYNPMYPGAQPPNPDYGPFQDWLEKAKEEKERKDLVKRMQKIIDEWTDKMREKDSGLDKITIDKIAEKTDPKEKDTDKSDSEDKTMIGVSAKYELIETSSLGRSHAGEEVYRLKALRDFGDVKAGDLGGLVSGDSNLDHDGCCWVHYHAMALNESRISKDAQLKHYAMALDHAVVSDSATIYGMGIAKDLANVCGNAKLKDGIAMGHSTVEGNAKVNGNFRLIGYATIGGDAQVTFDGIIGDNVEISDDVEIRSNGILYGNVLIDSSSKVLGDVELGGSLHITDTVVVKGNTKINAGITLSGSGIHVSLNIMNN